jgi:hypothetical protein
MSIEGLVTKYIGSSKTVLTDLRPAEKTLTVEPEKIRECIQWARNYLADAEYFREKKKFEVSLTSVAYCEGLLDALRLLGAVSFEWPDKSKETREEKRF